MRTAVFRQIGLGNSKQGEELGVADDILYHTGETMIIGGIVVGGISLVCQGYPLALAAAGVSLAGESLKETAQTLEQFAHLLEEKISSGASSIQVEVERGILGEKIIVSGNSVESVFSPRLYNQAGGIVTSWMLHTDNNSAVIVDGILGSYYWRRDDGSLAFP